MSKACYIAPEHFRIRASCKTKQAKFRIRSLVTAQEQLDKKYVRDSSLAETEKKKSEAAN